jgi:heat shock protein HtpX
MASLYTQQDSNVRKTWLFMTIFFFIIIGLGWAFSTAYDAPEILYFAVFLSIVMNITSYWYSDKIVLGMYRARPITRESHKTLWNIVENLSITAGLPMPRVYVIADPSPNAFATGRDAKHAAVAVTTGILAILDRNELEGVIAHELSHIGNRDILISTIVVVLVGLISILADWFLRIAFYGGRSRGRGNQAQAVGMALSILAPIVAVIIQLAISRKREFLADASGALLTRYPEGLALALEKISSHPVSLSHASKATAHLFISNPFGIKAMSGMNRLFMTHPPIEERVKALREQ